ncbi:B12-binding domain-containing radical SAM protein [Nocardia sp. R16R-3T]
MKVSIVSAPCVNAYINLDYNFVEIGEVAAYLEEIEGHDISVVDGVVPGTNWSDLLEVALGEPAKIILHASMENLLETDRYIKIIREISPRTQTIVYGRGAYHLRRLFQKAGADWIVVEQDWEIGISDALRASEPTPLAGVLSRKVDEYLPPLSAHQLSGEWQLPSLKLLPIEGYSLIPSDESYPQRQNERELAVGISRGCDSYCGYCPIPDVMGKRELFRRDLTKLAAYLAAAHQSHGFSAVSLFGANFTRHRDYTLDFCRRVSIDRTGLSWKCVTSADFLDTILLDTMAAAGCSRIAIGVESLHPDGRNRFGWRIDASHVERLARTCASRHMTLICFVMVGLPGQTASEVAATLRYIDSAGGVPRPMTYVDYRRVARSADFADVFWANRKTVLGPLARGELSVHDTAMIVHSWRKWLDEI